MASEDQWVTGREVQDTAGTVDQRTVDVLMVTGPSDGASGIGDYAEELTSQMPGARVETVSLPVESGGLLPYLARAVEVGTADADLVHVQHEYGMFGSFALSTWLFFPLVYLLCRLRGVPVGLTVHEALNRDLVAAPLKPVKQIYVELLNRCITLDSAFVVFLSENTARRFTASVPLESYTVFPHGVNVTRRVDLSSDEAKRLLGYDPSDVVVSEPGYVEPRKGYERLIDLAERLPEYEFLVAGGSSSEAYEAYLDALERRAPDNLRITGRLDEERFHAAFVASDLVVLPYRETEQRGVINTVSQSGIFNRCATYGNPVLASGLEHFQLLEEEWDCLRTHGFEEPDVAADVVERLLTDEAECDRLSRNIRAYAEANSFRSVAERHVALYRVFLDVEAEGA